MHDGTETTSDSMGLELEFVGVGNDVPSKFRKTYGFTVMIQIARWNDKPVLTLPEEGTLVMVVNTEVR